METAKCISRSTGLYNPEDKMWVVADVETISEMEEKLKELLKELDQVRHVILYINF